MLHAAGAMLCGMSCTGSGCVCAGNHPRKRCHELLAVLLLLGADHALGLCLPEPAARGEA
jgi:hypothetical protein